MGKGQRKGEPYVIEVPKSRVTSHVNKYPYSAKNLAAEQIEQTKKFSRGVTIDYQNMKLSKSKQKQLCNYENIVDQAVMNSLRTNLLNNQEVGLLEVENDGIQSTTKVKQTDIVKNVDLTTANNFFTLSLKQFGPYTLKYGQNGKHLLLGGSRGHLAGFDWRTKRIKFEVHVRDKIRDISWLHNETRLAVAQKEKVFVYDNKGVEISRIKALHQVTHMEFLQYHFLLACARKRGYLSYLDTSIGVMAVEDIKMGMGDPTAMSQNPTNAILHVGHTNGTVSLWSPNCKDFLLKVLCHPSPIVSIAINPTGNLLATSDMGRFLKIWDVRACKNLRTYKVAQPANCLSFSQQSLLGFSVGNVVEVWKDVDLEDNIKWRYMRHNVSQHGQVHSLNFCPFEDVLGVGHTKGMDSLIIPGSAEGNFDSLEANPYETTKQRQENEVKSFLDKIQANHISLQADSIIKVGKPLENERELRDQRVIDRLLPRVRTKAKSNQKLHKAQTVSRNMRQREKRRLQLVREARNTPKKHKPSPSQDNESSND